MQPEVDVEGDCTVARAANSRRRRAAAGARSRSVRGLPPAFFRLDIPIVAPARFGIA
jgi:hypothetical protein